MCTLTFIPQETGFIITSNRDEQAFRPTLKPKIYFHGSHQLIYPKDEVANGSWIAVSNHKKMSCLLNGGFVRHERKAAYTKSRGLVLLESLTASSFTDFIQNCDLNDIEPFTLLLLDFKSDLEFSQLVWDGARKYVQLIDANIPRLWSSAPLYSVAERQQRQLWFNEWQLKHNSKSDFDILEFHRAKHTENSAQNILMKGQNQLQTVSVSQIIVERQTTSFYYEDLKDDSKMNIDLFDFFKENGKDKV